MINFITRVALSTTVLSLAACASTQPDTQVFINSGAKQCLGLGKSLDQTAKILTDAGIDNAAASCGQQQGVLFPAVCGGGTPDVNIHTISQADVTAAKALGFKEVKGADIKESECKTKKPSIRPNNQQ